MAASTNGFSGKLTDISAFSSVGPTSDGRIKPELVAPGSNIVSAATGTACGTKSLSGTSMATPIVAGAAALVRQYLREGFYPGGVRDLSGSMFAGTTQSAQTPSAALVKAMLIQSAQPLLAPGGGRAAPDYTQGYGMVQLDRVLVTPASDVGLWLTDRQNISTGGLHRRCFYANTTASPTCAQRNATFKATLVWSDFPSEIYAGRNLVNDLHLYVSAASRAAGPSAAAPVYGNHQFEIALGAVLRVESAAPLSGSSAATVGDTFSYVPASFGGGLPLTVATAVVARLVRAIPANGCSTLTNLPAQTAGAIVLVSRGICYHTTKALHAQAAGALAVLEQNNIEEDEDYMLYGSGTTAAAVVIPIVGVSSSTGHTLDATLTAAAKAAANVTMRLGPAPPPGGGLDTDDEHARHRKQCGAGCVGFGTRRRRRASGSGCVCRRSICAPGPAAVFIGVDSARCDHGRRSMRSCGSARTRAGGDRCAHCSQPSGVCGHELEHAYKSILRNDEFVDGRIRHLRFQ